MRYLIICIILTILLAGCFIPSETSHVDAESGLMTPKVDAAMLEFDIDETIIPPP